MVTIDVPRASATQEVELAPEDDQRQLLKVRPDLSKSFRLSLGIPIVVPLTAKQVSGSKPITDFFNAHKENRFFLVRLATSFASPNAEPVTRAWLKVGLKAGKAQAMVIAMDPMQISKESEVKQSVKDGISLKMFGATLGFESTRETTAPQGDLFMTAHGLQTASAGWELRETGKLKIGGAFAFDLIVRTADKETVGRIQAMVEVRRKLLGLISYKSKLDEHPTGKFLLPKSK